MSPPPKEGKIWAVAAVLSLPAFLLPVYNPDLFWHLSAGRWIIEHRALPRSDWLSFTSAETPWVDFEWLAQLIFEGAYRLGGYASLWVLKGVLLLGIWFFLDKTLELHRLSTRVRAAGLVLWSAAAVMHADIRPELFSLLLFALVLWILEGLRLGRRKVGAKEAIAAAALFAFWADLHLGFLIGLAVIALYGAAAASQGERRVLKDCGKLFAAALAGTLINPYGAGPYQVAWQHWNQGANLARYIAEWRPMSARNPVYWPFWLLLALTAAASRRLALAPVLCAAVLGAAAIMHERTAPFFSIAAVPLICLAAATQRAWGRRVLAVSVAACAAFALWLSPRLYRAEFFNDKFVPRIAAEFVDRERTVFTPLRVYNPWEWGGYLGWRLAPWHRVYDDGRYIFHERLPREAAAIADTKEWQRFIDDERIDAMLLQNLPKYFPTTKAYPDGSAKSFDRPYYLFYAPRKTWALVHWDETALLFVRRASVPAGWLKDHEYRYVRPRDSAAFAEAVERKEIPQAKVAEEVSRHEREARELARGLR